MTIENLQLVLTVLAALGCGMIAGVFFIFSVAIMRALERVPNGAVAMQSINVVILNPLFLGVFMGTAVLCIVLSIFSIIRWQTPGSTWVLAASLLYLMGSFGVTIIFNVPLNNTLAAVTAENTESVWANYRSTWTSWNHVRTVSSVGAAASFIMAKSFE